MNSFVFAWIAPPVDEPVMRMSHTDESYRRERERETGGDGSPPPPICGVSDLPSRGRLQTTAINPGLMLISCARVLLMTSSRLPRFLPPRKEERARLSLCVSESESSKQCWVESS